jgi:proteasome assembly chaperone (PAC2) family protein
MDNLVKLWEKPAAEEKFMIAGWQQWADAGSVSSGLPHYLVGQTGAKKIGEIESNSFYLFQIPGTHHFLRPEIKLQEGYRQSLESRQNEFFYSGDDKKGLFIFLGDEPHLNAERYAEAFFNAALELGVKRIAVVGGVYGPVPYDKERDISCTYSLPRLKAELAEYALKFSNYQGGVSIGSYLADAAERKEIEYISFYALVPAYDFSQLSSLLQGMRIENDFKAWYDLMRRFNHMFGLGFDLSELQHQSEELTSSMAAKIVELERKLPQFNVREYIEQITKDFAETSFMPLDDVWERELGDLLEDLDD